MPHQVLTFWVKVFFFMYILWKELPICVYIFLLRIFMYFLLKHHRSVEDDAKAKWRNLMRKCSPWVESGRSLVWSVVVCLWPVSFGNDGRVRLQEKLSCFGTHSILLRTLSERLSFVFIKTKKWKSNENWGFFYQKSIRSVETFNTAGGSYLSQNKVENSWNSWIADRLFLRHPEVFNFQSVL